MRNTKKMIMTLAVAMLGLGLSACGRDNYNGSYSGTQIRMPQQAQTGQNGQQPMPGNWNTGTTQFSGITADLRHDGDIVTGTYNTTQQQMGTQFPTGGNGQQETYRFEATARNSNRLEGVRLIPLNSMMGGGCVVEGNLEAIENGRRLTGTLNPSNMGSHTMNSWMCGPLQITLDRAR